MGILEIVITACGAAVISGLFMLLSQCLQRRAERKSNKDEKLDAITQALRLTMLDRIKYLGQCYIRAGEVDFDDRRLLNQMHEVYHNRLNGNGDLDVVMAAVNKLPLKGKFEGYGEQRAQGE